MRQRSLVACIAITVCASVGFASERTIEASFPADQIETLSITNGVGDFVLETDDTTEIRIEITLTPRRGGIFSSMKRAEEDVARANLISAAENNVLRIELDTDSNEPRFEARWRVVAPPHLALDLEQGVGDVDVNGLAGGVEMEVGVGTTTVVIPGGEVGVSVGVGNGTVRGPAGAFASANASGGVGGAVIEAQGEIFTGEGFVSHSSSWRGDGVHAIELEVGVGDAKIVLE